MNYMQEATYLVELDRLCETMLLHAERFAEARRDWLEGRGRLARRVRITSSDQSTAVGNYLTESIPLQGSMWLALEGFLTAWARASLMLFPSTPKWKEVERRRAEDRALYLRGVLAVDNEHQVSNRRLRNAWMHFDEELDAALEEHGRVTPQRFVEQLPPSASPTMRMIVVESNHVVFRDTDTYSLDELFAAAGDLSTRVEKAQESVGERHEQELSAPNPLEY